MKPGLNRRGSFASENGNFEVRSIRLAFAVRELSASEAAGHDFGRRLLMRQPAFATPSRSHAGLSRIAHATMKSRVAGFQEKSEIKYICQVDLPADNSEWG
jgi:hypothetical protein